MTKKRPRARKKPRSRAKAPSMQAMIDATDKILAQYKSFRAEGRVTEKNETFFENSVDKLNDIRRDLDDLSAKRAFCPQVTMELPK